MLLFSAENFSRKTVQISSRNGWSTWKPWTRNASSAPAPPSTSARRSACPCRPSPPPWPRSPNDTAIWRRNNRARDPRRWAICRPICGPVASSSWIRTWRRRCWWWRRGTWTFNFARLFGASRNRDFSRRFTGGCSPSASWIARLRSLQKFSPFPK